MTATTLFVPLNDHVKSFWPKDLFPLPPLTAFERIWIEPVDLVLDPALTIKTALLFETELAVDIPGLDAVKLVFAPNGSYTAFALDFFTKPTAKFQVTNIPIAVRLDPGLLKPARRVKSADDSKPDTFEVDTSRKYTDITLGKITFSIDTDGDIGIAGAVNISLPPTFIGGTGVVIEASNIGLYLDRNSPPAGKSVGWRGVHISKAKLYLPAELAGIVGNLELTNAYIGNGGFSGKVSDTWTPALSTTLFGMKLGLKKVSLEFRQNALIGSEIKGELTLPYFDQPIDVEIGFDLNGNVSISIDKTSGIVNLSVPNVLDLKVDSLGFERKGDDYLIHVGGEIKPKVGGLDWPSFKVKKLTIDSDGNVSLDGGWLNLKEQYALDFYGFTLEITKLGFGKTEDGGKWVGFS
ncbi:MAG: hypothetical protein GTO18_15165, partial [Anaerolineales bacterium]|nr:hypothetical protein [Anaerolineales bacterium]